MTTTGKLRNIEKVLSYRLPLQEDTAEARLLQTAEHWADFSWETGREIVEWNSTNHGVLQVWASTQEEGMGVIRHALEDMAVPEEDGDWIFTQSKSKRNGRHGTVLAVEAACRVGPSGNAKRFVMALGSLKLKGPTEA